MQYSTIILAALATFTSAQPVKRAEANAQGWPFSSYGGDGFNIGLPGIATVGLNDGGFNANVGPLRFGAGLNFGGIGKRYGQGWQQSYGQGYGNQGQGYGYAQGYSNGW